MDDVELEFKQDALEAIVDKAIERNTGARGLRSIIEEIMRDVMYDIPSNPKIAKCIITKETVALSTISIDTCITGSGISLNKDIIFESKS